jgi:hypothetical protein
MVNVENQKSQTIQVADKGGCLTKRVRESESVEVLKRDKVAYSVQCKRFLGVYSLSLPDLSSTSVVYKTQGKNLGTSAHGPLSHAFL